MATESEYSPDADPGYVHRGEEKMAEYRNYMQNIPHLERPDGLDSCGILFPYAEAVDASRHGSEGRSAKETERK